MPVLLGHELAYGFLTGPQRGGPTAVARTFYNHDPIVDEEKHFRGQVDCRLDCAIEGGLRFRAAQRSGTAIGQARAGALVARLLDDPDAAVRGAAVWALARLDLAASQLERSARQANETDATVRSEWDGSLPAYHRQSRT